MHAMLSNNSMVTTGTAEPSKSEKTAMLAVVRWVVVTVEEVDSKVAMERVVDLVVAEEAMEEVVEVSVVVILEVATEAVDMEVAALGVPADMAAIPRSKLHRTHSPTLRLQEERGAQSFMPEM